MRRRGPVQQQVKIVVLAALAFGASLLGPWWHVTSGGQELQSLRALDKWQGAVAVLAMAALLVLAVRHGLGWHTMPHVRALAIAGGISVAGTLMFWQSVPSARGGGGYVGPTLGLYVALVASATAGIAGLTLLNQYR